MFGNCMGRVSRNARNRNAQSLRRSGIYIVKPRTTQRYMTHTVCLKDFQAWLVQTIAHKRTNCIYSTRCRRSIDVEAKVVEDPVHIAALGSYKVFTVVRTGVVKSNFYHKDVEILVKQYETSIA